MLLRLHISQGVEEVEVAPVPQHLVRHELPEPHEHVARDRCEGRLEVLDATNGVLDLISNDEGALPLELGLLAREAPEPQPQADQDETGKNTTDDQERPVALSPELLRVVLGLLLGLLSASILGFFDSTLIQNTFMLK